jgi:predicted enzyme related to lactoylglutathione lyase
MPHGTFVWNELMTGDVDKAKVFYGAMIGWEFDEMPMPAGGSYWIAKIGGKPVAGMMNMTGVVPSGTPPHWFAYLEVDDVDARIAKIAANGGTVIREPFEIEGVGRIAIVADATGAVLGWMTPAVPQAK